MKVAFGSTAAVRERPVNVGSWHVRDVTPAATRAAAIKGGADIPARSPVMLRPRCRTLRALSCSDPNSENGSYRRLGDEVSFYNHDTSLSPDGYVSHSTDHTTLHLSSWDQPHRLETEPSLSQCWSTSTQRDAKA